MAYQQELSRWVQHATQDPDLCIELEQMGKEPDSKAVTDAFWKTISFGTGGLRGELGAGPARMNLYTVRHATQGLADYLLTQSDHPSVAIAYDSRIKSDLFARESAAVLAANGITAYLYPRLMPTPALSFAVRHLHCTAGICITASHNPARYNGYKVYGTDGCQITLEVAAEVQARIAATDLFTGPRTIPYEQGLADGTIRLIAEETVDAYLTAVEESRVETGALPPIKVVYTPLHGTGLECVTRILERTAVGEVLVVPAQKEPDGHFPTVNYPNPEEREALTLGLALSEEVQADLLLATDPDCDRVGIAVPSASGYRLLTGNEVGVLLLQYLAERRTAAGTLPKNAVAIKTIVTTELAVPVAKSHGIALWEVLTGFKFIGEQIGRLEQMGEVDRYLFGFEESYGYLAGHQVRDKDAVEASMLICEMVRYYHSVQRTLPQVLEELCQRHGYYQNRLLPFAFSGAEGAAQQARVMESLLHTPPTSLAGLAVTDVTDYSTGRPADAEHPVALPPSEVLELRLAEECKVIVRPSGTEPKMKIYLFAKGTTQAAAEKRLDTLATACNALIEERSHK